MMQINLKKLVGVTAIAGALGLPGFVVGAGAANAATPAPAIPGPAHTVQTPADLGPTHIQPVDDDGGWGWGGWGHHGDWDRGGWGDRDWGWGGRGGWGWGGWGWGR